MSEIEFLARQAAIQASNPAAVGNLIERIEEAEPGVVTYRFESRLKGYVGWRWAVSLYFENDQVSISEVNLVAGENSILAPKWVPWSERLADYKALQAALEQQAAEEADEAASQALAEQAADGEETDVHDEDIEDDFEEVDEVEELATDASGMPVTEDAENDANEAGRNSFFRIFRRGKKRN